jgi:3',5'-cyclic AMP phosphodiesterase CpdA
MHDSLVQITDLHFWSWTFNPLRCFNKRILGMANVLFHRALLFKYDEAGRLVARIAALKPGVVLISGDLTSTSLDAEFRKARVFADSLLEAGCRLEVFPGNHDRYTFESTRKRRFEKHFADVSNNGSWPYLRRISEYAALVCLDEARPNVLSAKGQIGEAQIAAAVRLIETEARDCPFIIVAGHYPLLNATEFYSLRRGRRLLGAENLRSALGRLPKTVLYSAGHVHRSSFVKDPHYPNLSHLTTRAPFRIDGAAGRPNLELTRVGVGKEGFSLERHFVKNGEWVAKKV